MSEKIYITGIGAITAIGNNVPENLESLKAKNSGIGKINFLDTGHKDEIPVGEVKMSDSELIEYLDLSE